MPHSDSVLYRKSFFNQQRPRVPHGHKPTTQEVRYNLIIAMKTVNIRSLDLPDGVPVPQFETLKEALAHVKNDESKLVEVINKYGRQKDSLVNAREFLSDEVHKVHPRLTKDGKAITDQTDLSDYEPEAKHLKRATAQALAGKVKLNGLVIPPANPSEKPEDHAKRAEAAVWTHFQTIINKGGPFAFDLNATARVGAKKKLPQFAIDGARTIITNGTQAKWVTNFSNPKGFDYGGITVGPIAHDDFTKAVPAGATEEQAKEVRASNELNLARAIYAADQERTAKAAQGTFK